MLRFTCALHPCIKMLLITPLKSLCGQSKHASTAAEFIQMMMCQHKRLIQMSSKRASRTDEL